MNFNEIAVKCPAGQIYEECSDKCYRSCADIESTMKTCRTKCVEGELQYIKTENK